MERTHLIRFFLMTLSLMTLNARGCSSSVKNASLYTYVDKFCHKPDVVFLQETSVLDNHFSSWNSWHNYTPFCNPSPSRGSGVTTLIKNNITVLETASVFDGYVTFSKIAHNDVIFYLYNILIPQADSDASKAIDLFLKHSDSRSDGVIIVGGDFNCTFDPELDRLGIRTEHRPKISMALENVLENLSLYDVWRRRKPAEKSTPGTELIPPASMAFQKPDWTVFIFPLPFCPPSPCVKFFPVLCQTTRL